MFPHEDSLSVAHARVESALKTAWAHGMAGSRPLAVLLAGFDGGEKAASEGAVTALERALAVHCARTHDAVLRRAADEFIAFLPDTAPTGARHVGEQIVEAMRGRDGNGTVSVGLAVAVPDESHDPVAFLRRAERALQAARDNGGDRVTGGGAAGTGPSPPKGAFAQLRDLLPGRKKDSDLKRRTD